MSVKLCVFVLAIGTVSAFVGSNVIEEEVHDLRKVSTDWKKLEGVKEAVQKVDGTGCNCVNNTCGCCVHLKVPKVKLDDTGCVNVTYLPSPIYGISVTFSLNGVIYYNYTVSVHDPPPLCFGIPHLQKYAGICLLFYDIEFTNNSLSACVKLEIKLEGLIVDKFDLGCFKIPPIQKTNGNILSSNPKENHGGAVQKADGTGCNCVNNTCGCCVHLKVPKVKLDDTGCVNVTYLPSPVYGMSVTFSLDGIVYYNYTVSVHDPPPLCFAIPGLKKYASICLAFYNIEFTNSSLSACVKIDIKLEGLILEKYDLGCFKIPPTKKLMDQALQFIPAKSFKGAVQKPDDAGCTCIQKNCACCGHLKVPKAELDHTSCINITYLPSPMNSISVSFALDGVNYYNDTVSVYDPPPLCFGIPHLEKYASICLILFNVVLTNNSFAGCVSLEVRLQNVTVGKYNFGCFSVPPSQKTDENHGLKYIPMKSLGGRRQKETTVNYIPKQILGGRDQGEMWKVVRRMVFKLKKKESENDFF